MMRIFVFLLLVVTGAAHEVSESFLRIERTSASITGRWEVSLRDLEVAVGLDADQNDTLTWTEIMAARPKLAATLRSAVSIEGTIPQLANIDLSHKSGGTFLALEFSATLPSNPKPSVKYDFMFPYDSGHRALLTFVNNGSESLAVLTRENREFRPATAPRTGFLAFIRQGIVHIWEGTDHIFFLLALLLPAVIGATGEKLQLRDALIRVCKIVTAFTLAHSITLALATFGWLRLPSRLVESVIALSVLLAAANNIARIWNDRSWLFAFFFGLIHGFGFASVLSELQLERGNLMTALVGFNGGVEIGQLAIVAIFLPTAYLLRETWFYRRLAVVGGSAAIMLLASQWIFERAFSIVIFSSTLPR